MYIKEHSYCISELEQVIEQVCRMQFSFISSLFYCMCKGFGVVICLVYVLYSTSEIFILYISCNVLVYFT